MIPTNIKKERLYEDNYNYQGCLMKIIEYNKAIDIVVEFQDNYKAKVHTEYSNFLKGQVKNPYYPSVHGVGILGIKYPPSLNGKITKEYKAWISMLNRCFKKEYKNKYPTYIEVTCCNEWLIYENFYEWLHSQPNFDKWLKDDKRWCLDKDIIIKGNTIYSPNTCCLVPENVNNLFIKPKRNKKTLPIGVGICGNKYKARYNNPNTNKVEHLGVYSTPEEAFFAYKSAKENHIKQMAQKEYDEDNITIQCYNAMINYKVEITD